MKYTHDLVTILTEFFYWISRNIVMQNYMQTEKQKKTQNVDIIYSGTITGKSWKSLKSHRAKQHTIYTFSV